MEKQEQFQRQAIYFDKSRHDDAMRSYYTQPMIEVNKIIPRFEAAFKRKFTDSEKIIVGVKKSEGVMSLLRPAFQFKDATDDFNLQCMGLSNITGLLRELNSLRSIPSDLTVIDGQLALSENFLKQLRESNTQYLENQNQKEVYDFALHFIEQLHKLQELGYLRELNRPEITRLTSLIAWNAGKFIPNRHTIRDIK